jgi:hypothetical protein
MCHQNRAIWDQAANSAEAGARARVEVPIEALEEVAVKAKGNGPD